MENFIFYLSFSTAGLAAIIGSKLIQSKTINLLVVLVAISFLADVINAINSYYYMELKIDLGIRNVGGIYRVLEFMILCQFFNSFKMNRNAKRVLNTLTILMPAYFIIFLTDFFKVHADVTTISASSAFLTIIFSILFYRKVIMQMVLPNINKWPPFYLISSQFIYFCGVIVAFFIFKPIMIIDYYVGMAIWTFHNAWLIVRNILLIIGFYYTYKTKYKWSPISIL
uniref:hypothetical protein n=1 Tax=Fulvivirga sp. TaxID=1931237 RepID=UPI0040491D5A